MDIFCDSHDITTRFEPYVIDLRRLFVFHSIPCGGAEGFVALGVKLEESKAFRLDLPAVLRNIHELAGDGITADEMLTMLALASGGAELVDGRVETVGLMRHVTLLRVLVSGAGAWSEQSARGQERRAMAPAVEAGEGVLAGQLPGAAIELALEQLRRQMSEMDRRMHRLEPVAAAPEAGVGQVQIAAVDAWEMNVPEIVWGEVTEDAAVMEEAGVAARGWTVERVHEVEPGYAQEVEVTGGAAAARVLPRGKAASPRVLGALAAALFFLVAFSVVRVLSSMHARTIFAKTATPAAVAGAPAATSAAGVSERSAVAPTGSGAGMRAPQAARVADATALPVPANAAPMKAVAVKNVASEATPLPTLLAVKPAVMERNLVASRKPVFPAAALAKRMDGTVVLNTFIAKNGSVSRMDVVSGAPPFVDSAMAAVSWRRYRPYLLRGRPVAVVTPVTVVYRLP